MLENKLDLRESYIIFNLNVAFVSFSTPARAASIPFRPTALTTAGHVVRGKALFGGENLRVETKVLDVV